MPVLIHGYLGELEPDPQGRYSEAFRRAVRWLIDVAEGGGKLTHDSGGATRWGIAQKWNPDLDVETLTRAAAVKRYHERYWMPLRADELPFHVAFVLFDAYVQNQEAPVPMWQGIVRVEADGVVGPDTIDASRHATEETVRRFIVARHLWYEDLGRKRPGVHGPSVPGWHRRLVCLAEALGWMAGRESCEVRS